MKIKWLYGGLLASALSLPAFGQVSFGVTIGAPPPPLRYEAPPPYLVQATSGSMATGFLRADDGYGIAENGGVHSMQAPIGRTPTMTIIRTAGMSTTGTGRTRIMTLTTGTITNTSLWLPFQKSLLKIERDPGMARVFLFSIYRLVTC
jgi:hypothetical protein